MTAIQMRATLTVENPSFTTEEALFAALDIIYWMSGSEDFGENGPAHQGWLNIQPRLEAIKNVSVNILFDALKGASHSVAAGSTK